MLKRAEWGVAVEIKPDGHISLADAYAVSLVAEIRGALIVGGVMTSTRSPSTWLAFEMISCESLPIQERFKLFFLFAGIVD